MNPEQEPAAAEPKPKVKHENLNQAIMAVMESVEYIQRKGHNTDQNYKYATAEQIVHEVRSEAIRHGLRISIGYSDAADLPTGLTRNGYQLYRVRIKGTVSMVHGDEREEKTYFGEGADTGDKATAKAQTSCLKQALRQIFLIETGEHDPDAVNPEGKETFAQIIKSLPKEVSDAFEWRKKRKFPNQSKGEYRSSVLKIINDNDRNPEKILKYLRNQGWKGSAAESDKTNAGDAA